MRTQSSDERLMRALNSICKFMVDESSEWGNINGFMLNVDARSIVR
jgi:hypothetical protein